MWATGKKNSNRRDAGEKEQTRHTKTPQQSAIPLFRTASGLVASLGLR
jgi:hypothetical protein